MTMCISIFLKRLALATGVQGVAECADAAPFSKRIFRPPFPAFPAKEFVPAPFPIAVPAQGQSGVAAGHETRLRRGSAA